MKILFAIQGTGNGHISRAVDVIPHLRRYGDVDILISGTQCDIKLQWKVKYRLHGLSFIFGKNGGIDLKNTLQKIKPIKIMKEVATLPVRNYDLVINDFEPISAWACKLRNVKCIGLSHQSAVLHRHAPKPRHFDIIGRNILKYYAPVTLSQGFHFEALDDSISTPVIRDDVRWASAKDEGHYTVYLPSYSDEKIINLLNQLPEITWHVFSKHSGKTYQAKNVKITPVNKEKFTQSLTNCTGILCNAGFETPAEALFLGKKLCVIPMKGQYEQQCNAAFLHSMNVTCLSSFSKDIEQLKSWVQSEQSIQVNYPDNLANVIDELIMKNAPLINPQWSLSIS